MAGVEWWIGLDSWVLQDGNYTDFATGHRRQFALELSYDRWQRLVPTPDRVASCRPSTGVRYQVTGELVHASGRWPGAAYVLDIGPLAAYATQLVLDDLEPPPRGTWLTGEIGLHVDPFMYMDELAGQPGMPPLIRTWTVEEVQVSTTPLVTVEYGDPRYAGPDEGPHRVADRTRESWATVERTDTDRDGAYRLRCTLEDAPPVSSMGRSGPRSPYGPLQPG